jgi:S1-C subfamily serine protease
MLIDIIIVILFLSSLMRGREIGLIRQACSAVGFFIGLFVAAGLRPHVISLAHSPLSRLALTFSVTLACAAVCMTLGEYGGVALKRRLLHHKINRFDTVLGAVSGSVALLLAVWLAAPAVQALPYSDLKQDVRDSHIVAGLDRVLPKAPDIIASLGRVIDPNGFPQVFAGLEPKPATDTPLPDLGSLNAAVKKDRASVVKIEGRGCGGIVEGSGFVASAGFIATNAHVVAGVQNPKVIDGNGEHTATAVWFDPNLDFAVLRVDDLAGKPLDLNTGRVSTGSAGAVLGYPGGGNFTVGPAAILDEFVANGRNIYGQGDTNRDVYELKATVRPGNSGGPLIAADGSVTGVVFAKSTTYDQIGYALAMQQVATELYQATTRNTVVSTAACAD